MRLSVIIPVHNSSKFINECLESVITQIGNDDEIILVENGSKDNTPELCREYEKENGFIKYIELGAVGVSVARNEGIKEAKGEWITFVDSDDALLSGALKIIDAKQFQNADIVIAGYSNRRQDSLSDIGNEHNEVCPELLAKGVLRFAKYKKDIMDKAPVDDFNNWASWGKFFKREFLVKNSITFPEGVSLSEDAAFCFQAYCAAKKVYAINQKIYFYRVNNASVSHTYTDMLIENNLLLIENFENYRLKYKITAKWETEYAAFYVTNVINVYLCINNPRFKADKEEKLQIMKDICEKDVIRTSIKTAPFCHLINGQKNSIKYARILLKLKKYKSVIAN